MAGIGFELQRLNVRGDLTGKVGSVAHAAIVAAGPWMFTILAIGMISAVCEQIAGIEALAKFRVLIVYAFAISLIGTAAVGILATRMISDAIYSRRYELIGHLFIAALLLGTAATALPALAIFWGAFHLPMDEALVALAASLLVAQIWIAHAFCGAVRDYTGITTGFLVGLLVAIVAAIAAAIKGFGTVGIVWGFNVGLTIVYFMLVSRILLTFPQPVRNLKAAFQAFFRAARQYWVIALAATVAMTAVWIDKWVMWAGPAGQSIGGSLWHAPIYDSAMFMAYLVIIPALSFFVMHLETDFFRTYQRFYASIRAHATLHQIEQKADDLQRETTTSLVRIIVVQAALCSILVLAAPIAIEVLHLQFRQIPILRYGAIGASFQFIFMAATSLLLFFDRQRAFLALQTLFLVLNAGLTWFSLDFGIDYYGFGYLLACLTCSLTALIVLARSFAQLNYYTFLKATDGSQVSNWISGWKTVDEPTPEGAFPMPDRQS